MDCWSKLGHVAGHNSLAAVLRDNMSARKSAMLKDNDILLCSLFIDPRINHSNRKFYSTELSDRAKVNK